MGSLENKDSHTIKIKPVALDRIRAISFKESYLDNLVEAEALLELVAKMVDHHDDILINAKAFMGVSILLEKITRLININENILSDSAPIQNTTVPAELDN